MGCFDDARRDDGIPETWDEQEQEHEHEHPDDGGVLRPGHVNTSRSPWETAWLAHARRLLTDDRHRARCDAELGAEAVARCDAADLRWPGYLGVGYRPGGLLLAATVHREFASGRPPLPAEARDALVRATRVWRDGEIDDDTWLTVLRSVYVAGLEKHWVVGNLLRTLGRTTGLRASSIASTNAARCQVVEDQPLLPKIGRIKRAVVDLCSTVYPLADLATILRPGALVVTKGTFDVAAGALDIGVPLFVVDQRQQCLRAPFDANGVHLPVKTLVRDWAPVLGRVLAEARHDREVLA